MYVVRKKLTPDEINPPYLRYNSETDAIQRTNDGGSTWIDDPGADPRSADVYRAPALATSDPRCDAAANMTQKMRTFVNFDVATAGQFGLASGLLALLLLVFPIAGELVDLILIIAGAILEIGASSISSAFTQDVYDALLCIFYDNIDADGQMSAAQLDEIKTEIAAQLDSVVNDVFLLHSLTLGEVGWSNAGARGEETGDCDTCEAWCYTFDLTAEDAGFAANQPGSWDVPLGHWESGTGWVADQAYRPDYEDYSVALDMSLTLPAGSYGSFVFTCDVVYGASPLGTYICVGEICSDDFGEGLNLLIDSLENCGGGTVLNLQLLPAYGTSPPGGSAVAKALTITGIGVNPFGEDNC